MESKSESEWGGGSSQGALLFVVEFRDGKHPEEVGLDCHNPP